MYVDKPGSTNDPGNCNTIKVLLISTNNMGETQYSIRLIFDNFVYSNHHIHFTGTSTSSDTTTCDQ